jgi:hypothetical protein
MKFVVFDLDETLGYFTQYGIFWDCLTHYLKNRNNTYLTQNDFNDPSVSEISTEHIVSPGQPKARISKMASCCSFSTLDQFLCIILI